MMPCDRVNLPADKPSGDFNNVCICIVPPNPRGDVNTEKYANVIVVVICICETAPIENTIITIKRRALLMAMPCDKAGDGHRNRDQSDPDGDNYQEFLQLHNQPPS